MRNAICMAGLSLAAMIGTAAPAMAQSTPSDVRDLVGARASGGETALQSRGYVNTGSDTGDDRVWTYWWNQQRGVCLSVATMNGRYDSIITTPEPDCRRGRPTTLPGPVGGPVDGRPTTLPGPTGGSVGGRPTTLPGPTGGPVERPTTLPGPTGGPVASGRTETIRFERGRSSAMRTGSLRGYETVTYFVDLRAGQQLAVSLRGNNQSGYFNLTGPRSSAAIFNGSISGSRYEGRTTATGTYRIDVYLMRSAARRGETMRYLLNVRADR